MLMRLSVNCTFSLFTWPLRCKFASSQKSEVQEIDSLSDGLPKDRFLSLVCTNMKLWSLHLIWKQVMSRCIMCITELFERFVYWDKHLDNFLGDCSSHCFVAMMRLFCPDLMLSSIFPPPWIFAQEVFCWDPGWKVSAVATYTLALRWMCSSPRTGCVRRLTPVCMWRENAIIQWCRWSDLYKWPIIMLVYLMSSRLYLLTVTTGIISADDLQCCMRPQCEVFHGFPFPTLLGKLEQGKQLNYK